MLFTIVLLERLYTYRYAVSQRYILSRDIMANIVNLWIHGLRGGRDPRFQSWVFFPEHFLGRKFVLAAPGQLGPILVSGRHQIPARRQPVPSYWMHRMQHTIPFLWELHSYHHRVTDLEKKQMANYQNQIDLTQLSDPDYFPDPGCMRFDPTALMSVIFTV